MKKSELKSIIKEVLKEENNNLKNKLNNYEDISLEEFKSLIDPIIQKFYEEKKNKSFDYKRWLEGKDGIFNFIKSFGRYY